jgi:tRNA-(ms[2]io[6]A)-hydroxylase
MSSIEISLREPTPAEWTRTALNDFSAFLINHAACERKASTTGMMFVVRYPDRSELVESMIQLAREELMHFHQVWRLLTKRGLKIAPDEKDPYMNALLKKERQQGDYGLLDRLLIFGITEARGRERFQLIGDNHPDLEMREFYSSLAEAEKRHHELFLDFALKYFPEERVRQRLSELLDDETEILKSLPLRPAVH